MIKKLLLLLLSSYFFIVTEKVHLISKFVNNQIIQVLNLNLIMFNPLLPMCNLAFSVNNLKLWRPI